ncbi:MAG: LysR family transcriptional regulator [Clostridium sp.]|nr:LysR family transcriptional regulator [Clostridium sp.]
MFRIFHYLDAVCKEQSFSRAAQRLYISQPALSITIKNFENEIGVQLFDRSNFPIQLTDVGVVYMEGVQRILAIEHELEVYIDDITELKSGKLILGAAHLFASHLIPRFIAQFSEKYPQLEIQLKEADMTTLQNLLLKGEVDIIVESAEFDDTIFNVVPLFEEQILLAVPLSDPINLSLRSCRLSLQDVLSNQHIGDSVPCVSFGAFSKRPFLILEKGHDMRSRLLQACRENGFEPQICMVINQLMTAYNMVEQQLAAAFVSDTVVKLCGKRENIAFYKIPQPVRNINLVYRKNRYATKAMQEFILFVTEACTLGLDSLLHNHK